MSTTGPLARPEYDRPFRPNGNGRDRGGWGGRRHRAVHVVVRPEGAALFSPVRRAGSADPAHDALTSALKGRHYSARSAGPGARIAYRHPVVRPEGAAPQSHMYRSSYSTPCLRRSATNSSSNVALR